jgi:hypothetical protein
LENDGDPSNDAASVTFAVRESITIQGYRIWDDKLAYPSGCGWVSFDSNRPETVTTINNFLDNSANLIAAGEQAGDFLYAYTANTSSHNPANFIKIDKDWKTVATHTASVLPADMAYDNVSKTMFAITYEPEVLPYQFLNTVNLTTGELTLSQIFEAHLFAAIACDKNGRLYGISSYGVFCSINAETGEVIEISETGIYPAYTQSMAFDHVSGRLFWAMTDRNGGRLIEINPATGAITDYGIVGGNAEIVSLYIPAYATKLVTPESHETITVYPNPSDGFITIAPVPEQSVIRIFDLSGRTLQTHKNAGGKVELNLNLRGGIYFVQIESNGEKVTKKLIIK